MGTNVAVITKGVRDTWARLGKTQRIVIMSSIAVVFVALLLSLTLFSKGPRYETLWSNLDPQDAGNIVTELERQSIPYELADQGRTEDHGSGLQNQAFAGVAELPSSGIVGFESIQGNSLGDRL